MGARYDGQAEWYDEVVAPGATISVAQAERLDATGQALDLCCGTGRTAALLRDAGHAVVGLDRSADQLRLARRRHGPLVRGDAAALPFADAVFTLVTAMWITTDVDDVTAVLREVARVLAPGGTLLLHGAHPCFNGPAVEKREDGGLIVHPVYHHAGWHPTGQWWREGGVRSRVGMRHVPLAELLNAVIDAGLRVRAVHESGEGSLPSVLTVRATRGPGR